MERAIELSTKTVGPKHSSTLTFRANLAELHVARGQLDLACPMLEELLELAESTLGEQSESVRNLYGHLGACRVTSGDRDAARELFAKARASKAQTDDAGVLLGLIGQVELDVEDGNVDEALAAARRAVKIPLENDVSGYGARASFALALALAADGKLDDARQKAESAERELAALGSAPAVLEKVRAWLRSHPER